MTKKLKLSLILIYCAAITLLFLPFIKQTLIVYRTQAVSVKQMTTTKVSKKVPIEAVQPPDLADVLAFEKKQTVQAAGQIIVPKVEISLPLFSGVTNEQLLVGAGTLFPERTPENHNIVVIGHHLGRTNLLFGKLLKVSVGDTIYLAYQNQAYQYTVSQTAIVKQTELQVLTDQNQSEITLITCDKPTQTDQRLLVKGQLVTQPAKKVSQEILEQKQSIEVKNHRKDRTYCAVVLILFLVSLLLGIRVINKNSR